MTPNNYYTNANLFKTSLSPGDSVVPATEWNCHEPRSASCARARARGLGHGWLQDGAARWRGRRRRVQLRCFVGASSSGTSCDVSANNCGTDAVHG